MTSLGLGKGVSTGSALRSIYRHVLERSLSRECDVGTARMAMNIERQCEPPTDGCPVTRTAYDYGVLSYFEQRANRAYAEINSAGIVLHAAALGSGPACVLLPGRSGRGKTTLAGLLVMHGLDYLSDELVCLDRDDPLRITGSLQKALSLKAGFAPCFAELTPCAVSSNGGEEIHYVDPEDVRCGSVADWNRRVEYVIAPRFETGSSTQLRRLSIGETVLELNGARVLRGDHIESLIAIARQAPGFALEFGDAETAVGAVLELLGAAEPAARRSASLRRG